MLCNQIVEYNLDRNNYARYQAVVLDIVIFEELKLGTWNGAVVVWICGNIWQPAGQMLEKLYNRLLNK